MPLRRLLLTISHYSLGSLLTTLAGLVSFPFLTRIFSVSDYGTMNLVSATLAALVAVGKMGLQHAIVRFHARTQTNVGAPDRQFLVSTAVLGMAAGGLSIALAWVAVVAFLPLDWLGDGRLRMLLTLIAALTVVQVVDSALVNLLRAEERSAVLTAYQVLKKYLGLGLMISSLMLIRRDLSLFYSAQIFAEVVALLFLGLVVFRSGSGLPKPSPGSFSAALLVEMLRYGVPMMLGWELSGLILSLGDRYLVQGLLGPGALGTYAAAYNLCQYVEAIWVSPWGLAITPIYLRLWDRNDKEQAQAFIERSLRYYILLGVPAIAGLAAIGPELLSLLASDKYRDGAPAIPYVVAGLIAAGAVPITGAGVFIQRRSWVAARYVVLSAILNLGLNVVLIPAKGIQGAALATFASYFALLACMTRAGASHLSVAIPWGLGARAVATAAVMYLVLAPMQVGGLIGTLGAKIGLGLLVYGGLILAVEARAREALATLLARARGSEL